MAAAAVTFTDHSECIALTTLVQTDSSNQPGGRHRSLKRRQSLWLSEAPFDRVYRPEAGHLSIVGADEAGRELLLRTISTGEWFHKEYRDGQFERMSNLARASRAVAR